MIKIIPFNIYKGLVVNDNINELIGTQTIYPESIQLALIKTFIKDNDNKNINTNNYNDNMKIYCFEINNIYLQPTYVYDDNTIDIIMDSKCVIVSDSVYNQYFVNNITNLSENHDIHIVYNLPQVDMLKLKRIDGDFPEDGSIDELLTCFLESCIIINNKQQFTLDCLTNKYPLNDFITFEVDEIIYKEEPIRKITDRLEEMNITISFNKNLMNTDQDIGLDICKNKVTSYNWYYNTIGKKSKTVGYLANSEVSIDFIVTELPKIPEPKKVITIPEPEKVINIPIEPIDKFVPFIGEGNSISSEEPKQLSIEELRMKRLQALSNKNI